MSGGDDECSRDWPPNVGPFELEFCVELCTSISSGGESLRFLWEDVVTVKALLPRRK